MYLGIVLGSIICVRFNIHVSKTELPNNPKHSKNMMFTG